MTKARECRDRLADWAANEPRVAAAIVYGSVAAGTDHQYSDLDAVLVAHPNERRALWQERAAVAEKLLGRPVAWGQELPWQRPYRYQAWDDGFEVMVDLTFDEGSPELWRGLADAHQIVAATTAAEAQLQQQLVEWPINGLDASALNERAWPWLGYLDTNLRKKNTWMVRASLHDFLNTHVLPLLADRADAIDTDLTEEQRHALHQAAPDSHVLPELRRSLRHTADLYRRSLEDWAERHDRQLTVHPMAQPLLRRLSEE